ncbi:MAG: sugar ABC transporter substrate-binding protein [Nocardioidaceae bacterium]
MRRVTPNLATAAAATSLLLLLASCSGSSGGSSGSTGAAGAGTFRMDFANFTEAAPLFHVIHTNLDDVLAKGNSGLKVKWYDNAGDPAKMNQNAQLMVQDQPDAIVIYPVSAATQGVSQILSDGNIPCVSVNLDTPACSFLNIDNRALGEQTAQIVGKAAADRGWNATNTTVLIGQNAASGEQVNDCVRYFASTVAPLLGIPAVDPKSITPTTTTIGANTIQFDGASALQPSFEAVSNLLPSIPAGNNIILYTVNNDSTSGALRALDNAGRGGNDKLLIGGLGGDSTGITALRTDPRWVAEGDIFVSWWGAYAAAMAKAVAGGVKPPADVTPLPQIVLDKTTVDQYHKPNSADVAKLPPLVPNNQFLDDTGVLQYVRKVAGL